ncbi:hypothetical protein EVAR_8806_1 [Eumeta japonica]|uniref:FP protein C-terminal domain-containing protein n=1 Tax=Eumeta variegata TaxID=151549 RepID=A0A4C1TTW0_EUMVA|nr:hypothetical protein EVAR_8806_1 [Eumeta japonica]
MLSVLACWYDLPNGLEGLGAAGARAPRPTAGGGALRRSTTTAGIGISSDERRLYVNERVTRFNRHIFYRARKNSLNVNWKYVWTTDGKIYAQKEHGASRYRVRAGTAIEQMFGRK